MEYVYLVASLPVLGLTDPPPLTSVELLAATAGVLRPDHWEDLKAIVEDRPWDVRDPDGRRFAELDTQLRNAVARLRARRAGADYDARDHEHAGYDTRCETVAVQAMSLDDPLARELALDRFRWTLLDEIATFPAFGVQAVFAYGFKLRLAEKWAAMSEERGLDAATAIVERALAGRLA